ncbi:MAG: DNA polymerase/3'-5' exonuclease PolX, partial [Thermodesulfobacteriota bacterium]
MENSEIADILTDIVNLLEIKGDNPFRLRAYKNAILVIEELPYSLETIVEEESDKKTLEAIPGIGKGVSEKIHEILKTGSCHTLEELLIEFPAGLLDMLHLSGMGPKKVKLVFEELGVKSIRGLERAAKAGALNTLPGMGVKSEEKILKAIDNYKSIQGSGRFSLPTALSAAVSIIEYLEASPKVAKAEFAGSLRRFEETIGDLDILASGKDASAIMERFSSFPSIKEVVVSGETKTTVTLESGMNVDLRVVEPKSFGAALQYFTGSKTHNIALRKRAKKLGLKISEYGVFIEKTGKRVAGKTEKEVYKAIGLPYIPPEIRLNFGEIEAGEALKLPQELSLADIKGDLHMHTVESDGSGTIKEMAEEAIKRGYEYIAITEHSKATGVANGLDDKRLLKHIDRIDKFNESLKDKKIPFHVLKGAEVDIRADGSLDYPEEILRKLDIRIGAIHSGFTQSREKMTARVITALSSGLVDILAHPTGRIINIRAPYEIDMEAVIKAAKESGTAMELNSYPERLDLKDTHLRLARDMGVLISINTDSHSPEQLDNISYGIHTARRAWIEPKDVLNC